MVVKGWRKREKKEHFAKEGAGHLTQSMVFKLVKYSIWTQLVQLFIKWCDFGNTFAYILIWQVKAVSHTLFRELSAIMTGKGRVEIGGGALNIFEVQRGAIKIVGFQWGALWKCLCYFSGLYACEYSGVTTQKRDPQNIFSLTSGTTNKIIFAFNKGFQQPSHSSQS